MKKLTLFIATLLIFGCGVNKPFVKDSQIIHERDTIVTPGEIVQIKTLVRRNLDTVFYGSNYSAHLRIVNDSLNLMVGVQPNTRIIYKTIENKHFSTVAIEKKKVVIDRKEKRDVLQTTISSKKLTIKGRKDSLKYHLRKFRVEKHAVGFFGRIWIKIKNYLLFVSLAINVIIFLRSKLVKVFGKIF